MRKVALIAVLSLATSAIALGSQPVSAQTQTENSNTSQNVVIQPGDTLSKIAEAHSTTYVRLYDANTQIEHPDIIQAGKDLRIPAADEQIPSRPMPTNAQEATTPVPQPQAAAPAPRATKPVAQPAAANVSGGVWDQLAQCESGGNWSINSGNGFYGGLQFSASSWSAVGGSGLPSQASKSEQIARAEMLKARQGWGAWPACSAKLGLR